MTRLLLLVILATMATGLHAVDLDKLKKLQDKLKNPQTESSPAAPEPAAVPPSVRKIGRAHV